ncbi:MAG: hypothetical protein EXR66_01900 [Dehalococcoidia bacterium]|nr:hypothetical protein [Dehalococcoidia bacterium]
MVLYDARGTGMSDREGEAAGDTSLEAMQRDLDAVVAASQAQRPALIGFFNSAPVAILHTASGAEVSSLVLWGGFARGADVYQLAPSISSGPSGARLVEAQRGALAETAARSWAADLDDARVTVRYFGACASAEGLLRYAVAARGWDVTASLDAVRVPTLVMQCRATSGFWAAVSRRCITSEDAELVLSPDEAASPFSGDVDAGVDAVSRFLGLGAPATSLVGGEPPALFARGLANKGDRGTPCGEREHRGAAPHELLP